MNKPTDAQELVNYQLVQLGTLVEDIREARTDESLHKVLRDDLYFAQSAIELMATDLQRGQTDNRPLLSLQRSVNILNHDEKTFKIDMTPIAGLMDRLRLLAASDQEGLFLNADRPTLADAVMDIGALAQEAQAPRTPLVSDSVASLVSAKFDELREARRNRDADDAAEAEQAQPIDSMAALAALAEELSKDEPAAQATEAGDEVTLEAPAAPAADDGFVFELDEEAFVSSIREDMEADRLAAAGAQIVTRNPYLFLENETRGMVNGYAYNSMVDRSYQALQQTNHATFAALDALEQQGINTPEGLREALKAAYTEVIVKTDAPTATQSETFSQYFAATETVNGVLAAFHGHGMAALDSGQLDLAQIDALEVALINVETYFNGLNDLTQASEELDHHVNMVSHVNEALADAADYMRANGVPSTPASSEVIEMFDNLADNEADYLYLERAFSVIGTLPEGARNAAMSQAVFAVIKASKADEGTEAKRIYPTVNELSDAQQDIAEIGYAAAFANAGTKITLRDLMTVGLIAADNGIMQIAPTPEAAPETTAETAPQAEDESAFEVSLDSDELLEGLNAPAQAAGEDTPEDEAAFQGVLNIVKPRNNYIPSSVSRETLRVTMLEVLRDMVDTKTIDFLKEDVGIDAETVQKFQNIGLDEANGDKVAPIFLEETDLVADMSAENFTAMRTGIQDVVANGMNPLQAALKVAYEDGQKQFEADNDALAQLNGNASEAADLEAKIIRDDIKLNRLYEIYTKHEQLGAAYDGFMASTARENLAFQQQANAIEIGLATAIRKYGPKMSDDKARTIQEEIMHDLHEAPNGLNTMAGIEVALNSANKWINFNPSEKAAVRALKQVVKTAVAYHDNDQAAKSAEAEIKALEASTPKNAAAERKRDKTIDMLHGAIEGHDAAMETAKDKLENKFYKTLSKVGFETASKRAATIDALFDDRQEPTLDTADTAPQIEHAPGDVKVPVWLAAEVAAKSERGIPLDFAAIGSVKQEEGAAPAPKAPIIVDAELAAEEHPPIPAFLTRQRNPEPELDASELPLFLRRQETEAPANEAKPSLRERLAMLNVFKRKKAEVEAAAETETPAADTAVDAELEAGIGAALDEALTAEPAAEAVRRPTLRERLAVRSLFAKGRSEAAARDKSQEDRSRRIGKALDRMILESEPALTGTPLIDESKMASAPEQGGRKEPIFTTDGAVVTPVLDIPSKADAGADLGELRADPALRPTLSKGQPFKYTALQLVGKPAKATAKSLKNGLPIASNFAKNTLLAVGTRWPSIAVGIGYGVYVGAPIKAAILASATASSIPAVAPIAAFAVPVLLAGALGATVFGQINHGYNEMLPEAYKTARYLKKSTDGDVKHRWAKNTHTFVAKRATELGIYAAAVTRTAWRTLPDLLVHLALHTVDLRDSKTANASLRAAYERNTIISGVTAIAKTGSLLKHGYRKMRQEGAAFRAANEGLNMTRRARIGTFVAAMQDKDAKSTSLMLSAYGAMFGAGLGIAFADPLHKAAEAVKDTVVDNFDRVLNATGAKALIDEITGGTAVPVVAPNETVIIKTSPEPVIADVGGRPADGLPSLAESPYVPRINPDGTIDYSRMPGVEIDPTTGLPVMPAGTRPFIFLNPQTGQVETILPGTGDQPALRPNLEALPAQPADPVTQAISAATTNTGKVMAFTGDPSFQHAREYIAGLRLTAGQRQTFDTLLRNVETRGSFTALNNLIDNISEGGVIRSEGFTNIRSMAPNPELAIEMRRAIQARLTEADFSQAGFRRALEINADHLNAMEGKPSKVGEAAVRRVSEVHKEVVNPVVVATADKTIIDPLRFGGETPVAAARGTLIDEVTSGIRKAFAGSQQDQVDTAFIQPAINTVPGKFGATFGDYIVDSKGATRNELNRVLMYANAGNANAISTIKAWSAGFGKTLTLSPAQQSVVAEVAQWRPVAGPKVTMG